MDAINKEWLAGQLSPNEISRHYGSSRAAILKEQQKVNRLQKIRIGHGRFGRLIGTGDKNIVDTSARHVAPAFGDGTLLCGVARLRFHGDGIGSARCHKRVKDKVAVTGDGLIVSAVVLQDEAAADNAGDAAANADVRGRRSTRIFDLGP